MILICMGLLVSHLEKVSGIRGIEIALRWSREDRWLMEKNQQKLEAAGDDTKGGLNTKMRPATPSQNSETFQSSKRKVRKGSDPIHNRS